MMKEGRRGTSSLFCCFFLLTVCFAFVVLLTSFSVDGRIVRKSPAATRTRTPTRTPSRPLSTPTSLPPCRDNDDDDDDDEEGFDSDDDYYNHEANIFRDFENRRRYYSGDDDDTDHGDDDGGDNDDDGHHGGGWGGGWGGGKGHKPHRSKSPCIRVSKSKSPSPASKSKSPVVPSKSNSPIVTTSKSNSPVIEVSSSKSPVVEVSSSNSPAASISGTPTVSNSPVESVSNRPTPSPAQCTTNAQCSDGNACTSDLCINGVCVYPVLAGVVTCDDGNACTAVDQCIGGVCVGTSVVSCNDGDVCNGIETCNPSTGCVPGTPLVCADDGLYCNGVSACDPIEGCKNSSNPCDLGRACTVGSCTEGPQGPLCSASNVDCGVLPSELSDQCASLVCSEPGGCQIVYTHQNQRCEQDGNLCTIETCSSGACVITEERLCNDGVACTIDACNPTTGQCVYSPSNALCASSDFCAGTFSCDALHGCIHNPGSIPCDDSVSCTVDTCDNVNGCSNSPVNSLCDDFNVCNGEEICQGSIGCMAGVPISCDDGLFCNGVESCDPILGCTPGVSPCGTPTACTPVTCDEVSDTCTSPVSPTVETCDGVDNDCDGFVDNGATCPLGQACCGGSCVAATGYNTFLDCGSQNCTQQSDCPSGTTCYTINDMNTCHFGTFCGDGILQTAAETGGNPEECDDGNHVDGDGCSSTCRVECTSNAQCNDNLYCNGMEHCDSVLGCVPGANPCVSPDACTIAICNEVTDSCLHAAVFCPSSPVGGWGDLDNECAYMQCDPVLGCIPHYADGEACNTNVPCITPGTCQDGYCVGSVDTNQCDDGVACTIDTCNPLGGCLPSVPSDQFCSDDNVCNGLETCDAQSGCVSGVDLPCYDYYYNGEGDQYTDSCRFPTGCDPITGCIFQTYSGECQDGSGNVIYTESYVNLDAPRPPNVGCAAVAYGVNAQYAHCESRACSGNDYTCQDVSSMCDDGNPCNGVETCVPEDLVIRVGGLSNNRTVAIEGLPSGYFPTIDGPDFTNLITLMTPGITAHPNSVSPGPLYPNSWNIYVNLTDGYFTDSYLTDKDVVFVGSTFNLSTSEKTALKSWVQGGGLLISMVSNVSDPLLPLWGITINQTIVVSSNHQSSSDFSILASNHFLGRACTSGFSPPQVNFVNLPPTTHNSFSEVAPSLNKWIISRVPPTTTTSLRHGGIVFVEDIEGGVLFLSSPDYLTNGQIDGIHAITSNPNEQFIGNALMWSQVGSGNPKHFRCQAGAPPCGEGFVCQAGICSSVCTAGYAYCSSDMTCHDLSVDESNCGSCGHACNFDEQCNNGACCGSVEVCDGFDNDCNGIVDDGGFGILSCGTGACARTIPECLNGVLQTCTPGTPITELCNGIDDDCNGVIDNGPATCGSGQTCCGSTCVTASGYNSYLNCGNCTQQSDCPSGTTCYTVNDVNTCHFGTFCGDGILQGIEACDDGNHNNGDGCSSTCSPEPGWQCTTPGTPCTPFCGDGVVVGSEQCDNGANNGPNKPCSSTCTINPCSVLQETCNGIDDNCNGVIDDGLGTITCGIGACTRTVDSCVNGVAQTCTPGTPTTETCNGIDDDCDGIADEFLGGQSISCGVGTCFRSVVACVGGVTQTCTPGTPGVEVCNGIDDNCNGVIDDGVPTSTCVSPCGVSVTRACVNGAYAPCVGPIPTCGVGACKRNATCANGIATCTPGTPTAETCNGIDDDCDGSVDEDLGTTVCGSGLCQNVVQNCIGGVPQTCSPKPPNPEICNFLDDDCDGLVDEDFPLLGTPCSVPSTGSNNCITGTYICGANPTVIMCTVPGTVCNRTNGSPSCVGGVCGIICAPGFANCNGDASDGCEINSKTDANNCGACGINCNGSNGTPSCVNGICAIACNAGFKNCDGTVANGCETNVNSDRNNCGTCGTTCVSSANCIGGICVSPSLCGNGAINAGEACDDGNTLNGDGCSSNCLIESGQPCIAGSQCVSAVCTSSNLCL